MAVWQTVRFGGALMAWGKPLYSADLVAKTQPLPIPAETIRQQAAEVVARPEFQLGLSRRQPPDLWWLDWILRPLRWLFDLLSGVPDVLRWPIVVFLMLLLVVLIWHIARTFWQALQAPQWRVSESTRRELRASPQELERLAEQLASRGDWIGAIRQLFLAGVLRLEQADNRTFRKASTNHEILKRYRKSAVFEPLQLLVDLIDSRWYGQVPCEKEDYLKGQTEHRRIVDCIERSGGGHAVGA